MNDEGARRNSLIRAIFAEARKRGVSADILRNDVAPHVIRKRISRAGERDLARLLRHLRSIDRRSRPRKRFEASFPGLRAEVAEIAQDRFGVSWKERLNHLTARMFHVDRWEQLDAWHTRQIKETLIRLQRKGPYRPRQEPGAA